MEINEIESKKAIEKKSISNSRFFVNIKLQTFRFKKKKERTQINKIENERRDITIDTTEKQRIFRN